MNPCTVNPIGFQKSFERVCNGFVIPTMVGEGKISGCVYRADGSKVALSERFGGWKGDLFRSDNPDVLERPGCIERLGKGLYLGSLMAAHYGHFITEGLSTFWIFEKFPAEQFDYFLFSPFVFGSKIPGYALQCMHAFGIDPEKIVIMGEEAMGFEELVIPERLFRLNHSADPALAWVHRRIRLQVDEIAAPVERVYLSRRKVSFNQLTRVIANEVLVEKLFRQAGFSVIYPEALPFNDQLVMYANASVVAGPSGSALHNSLFMKPGTKLIELGDPRYGGERAPTQMLCDLVSGVETALIPFVGTIRGDGVSVSVDVEELRLQLIRVLDATEFSTPEMDKSSVRPSPAEWLECLYLSFRPMAGSVLRSFGFCR
jgi:Glycosyltransferase 61